MEENDRLYAQGSHPSPRPPLTRELSKIYLIFDWGREKSLKQKFFLSLSLGLAEPAPSSEGALGAPAPVRQTIIYMCKQIQRKSGQPELSA